MLNIFVVLCCPIRVPISICSVFLCNNFVHNILFIISDHLLFCHFVFRFRTTSYYHRNIFLTKQKPSLLTYYTYTNFTSFLFLDDASKYNFVIRRRSFLSLFSFYILKFYFLNYYYFNYFVSLTLFTIGLFYIPYSYCAVFMISSLYVASACKKPLPTSFPFFGNQLLSG